LLSSNISRLPYYRPSGDPASILVSSILAANTKDDLVKSKGV